MKVRSAWFLLSALGFVSALSIGAQSAPPSKGLPAQRILYRNTQYGFCFFLPATWKGYTIVPEQWRGSDFTTNQVVHGPQLRIRHPGWTQQQPFEDIPIMIFTPAEWDKVEKVTMSVSAAPIGPEKLGQNGKYVFALPPRYNFDFSEGYREVDDLLHNGALQSPCAQTTTAK